MTLELQAKIDEVTAGLQYIADSPPQEYGGFHPEAVRTAVAALILISGQAERIAELEHMNRLISDRCAEVDTLHPDYGKFCESLKQQLAARDEEIRALKEKLRHE